MTLIVQVARRLRSGDLRTLQTVFRTVLRETRQMRLSSRFGALAAMLALADGDHGAVRAWAAQPDVARRAPVALYCLAHSQFLCAQYEEAEATLESFLKSHRYHADAIYLQVDVLLQLGRREHAWRVLEALMLKSSRLKLWLLMAKLVQDRSDFDRLLHNYQCAQQAGTAPLWHRDTNDYLAVGALRCGNYTRARGLMRESFAKILRGGARRHNAVGKRAVLTVGNAARALEDIDRVLGGAGIVMFLVSGTLLGCIREGRLLGHDKDVDVGIWEDTPRPLLLATLQSSGLFRIQASRSQELVRVRHVNGTAIDVFFHYREADSYWHGGVKIRWHNRPFTLRTQHFMGHDYLVPADYDTYLTENCGNWRDQVTEFDSAFDTPNAEIVNHEEMAIYTYRLLIENRHAQRTTRYLAYLRDQGEQDFLAEIGAEVT